MNLTKKYTEDELTGALKMHDAQAFQYLYDNYKGALFTVIKQIITVNEIAEDVLQDAFTMAWKNIEAKLIEKKENPITTKRVGFKHWD